MAAVHDVWLCEKVNAAVENAAKEPSCIGQLESRIEGTHAFPQRPAEHQRGGVKGP
jgi:hypothetical protein